MIGPSDHIDSLKSDEFYKTISNAFVPETRKIKAAEENVNVPVPFPSPVDWRDKWIYFLMIDRFNNPDVPPEAEWNGSHDGFQGGKIKGVTEKLDYIKELGAGAVWVSPVFKNCPLQEGTYHGYGFQNLLAIDPRFGSEEDFEELVMQAHARGIYIILDIVLNHSGDVFAYNVNGEAWNDAPWQDNRYQVFWRNSDHSPNLNWTSAPVDCELDAAIWPKEFRNNDYFRQQGKGGELGGDFYIMKELKTELQQFNNDEGIHYPVRNLLIQSYQYLIAKYDIDGFRIDTFKFVSQDFARIFGNAIREFALGIGKKNFFTFGEVWDTEEKIREYVGKDASNPDEMMGVDAALDFPVCDELLAVVKGFKSPAALAEMFSKRKEAQKNRLSSHGEASQYFVTFLDNHDKHERFYYSNPADPEKFDDQLTTAIALLFSLQGIPSIYYGTEQGLHGRGNRPEFVREALWGKLNAFNENNKFYKAVSKISEIRNNHPALRYGRQYFRYLSDTFANNFDLSQFNPGVLAFSRILGSREILIAANLQMFSSWSGNIIVDFANNRDGSEWKVLYSNMNQFQLPGNTNTLTPGRIVCGNVSSGAIRVLPVHLKGMEIQIISNEKTRIFM